MHKSGTTLISQVLHKSGINMGFDITREMFEYRGNQCESPTVNAINNDILGSNGLNSLDIHHNLLLQNKESILVNISKYLEKASKSEAFGIKDPRMCFTYSIWKNKLPYHSLIYVFRNPLQVANHYKRKNRRNFIWFFKFLKRYIEYNEASIKLINRHNGPVLILNYNQLMTEADEFKRLEQFIGEKLCDMRDSKMYNERATNDFASNLKFRVAQWITGLDISGLYKELQLMHEQNSVG